MALITRAGVQLYHHLNEEIADPRVENWFLMRTPWPGLALLFLYLFIVFRWLPEYMKHREAYNLRVVLAVYNIVQIFGCSYLVYKSMSLGWLSHYKLICQPVDTGPTSDMYAWTVTYGYFLMKLLDLLDTVFFVLRKKQNQVTFLHVYHHFGMVMVAWAIVKWLPTGHVTLVVPVNCFVHTIMYTYYLLTVWDDSYKTSIWWKKHVTQIQILQFAIMLLHYGSLLVTEDCQFPKAPAFIMIPQDLFILTLFTDFYCQAYVRKINKKK